LNYRVAKWRFAPVALHTIQVFEPTQGPVGIPFGIGRLQSAALLAGIHIAILYSRDVYENLPQVLQLREVKEASAMAFVNGPSRTADIELSLTIGMHRPAEVHVFCLE
jgi:L-lactate dehydrogenase complex protein LldG